MFQFGISAIFIFFAATASAQNTEVLNALCSVPDRLAQEPIGHLCALRGQLERMKGVTINMGGINQSEAMKTIIDAIFDIERRLEAIEAKK
jgi:hypothetical protein